MARTRSWPRFASAHASSWTWRGRQRRSDWLGKGPGGHRRHDRAWPAFGRIRSRRHEVEYPSSSAPQATTEEVEADLPKAAAIVDLARKVIPGMGPFSTTVRRRRGLTR